MADDAPGRTPRLRALTVVVVVVALAITAALVVTTRSVRDSNEHRLLRQRAQQAAAVASASVQGLRAPLADAAVLAGSTDGDPAPFSALMSPIVAAGQPFATASLWRVGSATPLVVVGNSPALADDSPAAIRAFLAQAVGRRDLSVRSMLGSADRRLGYSAGDGSTYVAYGEALFPAGRKARIAKDSAFSDLDYALYFGRDQKTAHLLASSSGTDLPSDVRQASASVPFGDSSILVVVSPHSFLGGTVLAWLPWILLGLGLIGTVVAGGLTEYLVRRREHAERLAAQLEVAAEENQALYAEQREVAASLQRSLMPLVLPAARGLEIAGRYEAGVEGTEVGGDWYDVVPVSPTRLLFSVGDVSGRGLEAAATMASLRYSIRAYALDGSEPDEVLHKLTSVLSVARSGLFATVVCGTVDAERGTLTVARAGHPDLLLIAPDASRYLGAPVGPAIGFADGYAYESMSTQLVPGTTAVAFTDGLVERRGETIDVGLERLRQASRGPGRVEDVVRELVTHLAPDSTDDVAVLGLRWHGDVRGAASGTMEVPVA